MKKWLIMISLVTTLLLSGCGGSKKIVDDDSPYYEMLEDVVFEGTSTDYGDLKITVSKGAIIRATKVNQSIELVIGDNILSTNSSKVKGVNTLPEQEQIENDSINLIQIQSGVQLSTVDGKVLFHTQTEIPPIHYSTTEEVGGVQYYKLEVAGRVVLFPVSQATVIE